MKASEGEKNTSEERSPPTQPESPPPRAEGAANKLSESRRKD